MTNRLSRIIRYALDHYLKEQKLILLFSIPAIFSFLIPILVPTPTYLAIGGLFIRTGSIPDMTILSVIITLLGYAITVFLLSSVIVNINLTIKSKRTQNKIRDEVLKATETYGLRIFVIYTAILIFMFILQLATYGSAYQAIIYPLATFLIGGILFFLAPAIVIDDCAILDGITKSADMVLRKPGLVLSWVLIGFLALSIVMLIANLIMSGDILEYFLIFINALVILPFLTVLQTHMYMEKYPLAR